MQLISHVPTRTTVAAGTAAAAAEAAPDPSLQLVQCQFGRTSAGFRQQGVRFHSRATGARLQHHVLLALRCPARPAHRPAVPLPVRCPQSEASDVFFSVTKLFQHKDVHLRRMVYLIIKEIIPSSDEVIIITRWGSCVWGSREGRAWKCGAKVCPCPCFNGHTCSQTHPCLAPPPRSSLMKDMNSTNDLYRSNAIRVLCRIIDSQMLLQIERYLKQVGVPAAPPPGGPAQHDAAGHCMPIWGRYQGRSGPTALWCQLLLCSSFATLAHYVHEPVHLSTGWPRLWWTRALWWRARCWRGPSTWRAPMPRSSSAGATRCRRQSTAGTPWCSSRCAAPHAAVLLASAAMPCLLTARCCSGYCIHSSLLLLSALSLQPACPHQAHAPLARCRQWR